MILSRPIQQEGVPLDKLIVNLAPTGLKPSNPVNPNVPVSPGEIIRQVNECAALGVSIVHLHAREEDGSPTHRKEIFRRIIEGIRERRPDLVICVSVSGRAFPEFSLRSEPLDLEGDARPDMASLTLGSMNFYREASVNSPDTIRALAGKMAEKGIKPEIEIFDMAMIDQMKWLASKGFITPPFYANLILGAPIHQPLDPGRLALLVRELPPGTCWAGGAIGPAQPRVNAMAIAMGGHVRVGLEDNLHWDPGRSRLARNAELVERVVGIGQTLCREAATPSETRGILGLPQR
jgi:3-keto-5-aminohexanoate cleavage enzyme